MPVNAKLGRLNALYEAGAISEEELQDAKDQMRSDQRSAAWSFAPLAAPERKRLATPAFHRGPQVIALFTLMLLSMWQAGVDPMVIGLTGALAFIIGTTISMQGSRA